MTATISTRRTQAERSAETTQRLLDATLATLVTLGYRATTTTEIARRAGVSRGAMLHHYPSRASLLVAAAERMMETRIEEFRAAMATIDDSGDRIRAAIDLLWEIHSSDVHIAWTELALAARSEPEIAEVVAALEQQVRRRVRQTWAETFPELQDNELAGAAPDFAIALLEGLALRRLLASDSTDADRVIDVLKDVATLMISDPPIPPTTRE